MLFVTTNCFSLSAFINSNFHHEKICDVHIVTISNNVHGWHSSIMNHGKDVVIVTGDLLHKPRLFGPVESLEDWISVFRDSFSTFSAIIMRDNYAYAITDMLGVEPIFFTLEDGELSFGSSAKLLLQATKKPLVLNTNQSLLSLDNAFLNTQRIPLGSYVKFEKRHGLWIALDTVKYAPLVENENKLSLNSSISEIQHELFTSIRKVSKSSQICVPLSGGVDSATVASILSPIVDTLKTVTVGTLLNNEFSEARETVDVIKSEHREFIISDEDLYLAVTDVIRFHETWNLYTVSVASPATHLYRVLSGDETTLVSGYGADILFAGLKYPHLEDDKLNETLIEEMESLFRTHELRLDGARYYGIRVSRPYLTDGMIKLALSIPGAYKRMNGIEKFVMRKAVASFVPASASWRPKLAVNAGSGIPRALRNIFDAKDDNELQEKLTTLGRTILVA